MEHHRPDRRHVDLELFAGQDDLDEREAAFEPSSDSVLVSEALERFLASVASARTAESYRRRLEPLFARHALTYVEEISEELYLTAIEMTSTEDAPSPSTARQLAAAMRSFCLHIAAAGFPLDPLLDEAIWSDAKLRAAVEPTTRRGATTSNVTQGLASRDAFAGSLAVFGLGRHLHLLRITDLLEDVRGECWLAADTLMRHRGPARERAISGGFLMQLTPELHHLGLEGHRLLARGVDVPALFLTAQGNPAAQSLLLAAIRKRSPDEQVALKIKAIPRMPKPGPRRNLNTLIQHAAANGVSYRAMARATGVDSRYWWRQAQGRVSTLPPPGLAARLAVALGMSVETVLFHAGYDPKGFPSAELIHP